MAVRTPTEVLAAYGDAARDIVEGLLGRVTLVYGPDGAGKSLFIANAAAAITRGDESVFGCPTDGIDHRIVYAVTDPMGDFEMATRFQALGGSHDGGRFVIDDLSDTPLGSTAECRAWVRGHRERGATWIIFDNLYGVAGEEISNNLAVKPLLDALRHEAVSADHKVAVTVLHHTPKSPKEGQGTTPVGSRFIAGWTRRQLRLAPDGKVLVAHVSGNMIGPKKLAFLRDFPDSPIPTDRLPSGFAYVSGSGLYVPTDLPRKTAKSDDRQQRTRERDWQQYRGDVQTLLQEATPEELAGRTQAGRAVVRLGLANRTTNDSGKSWVGKMIELGLLAQDGRRIIAGSLMLQQQAVAA